MAYTTTLENVFSWSKSRAEQFGDCQRKYYYDRYVSWGGWDKNALKDARLAYVLKNLKNRWAWKGETVHHMIENALKNLRVGKPVVPSELRAALTLGMRREWLSSKAKKYIDEPKKTLGLFEHEYEKAVADAVWKAIHDEASQALDNFFSSAFYQELLTDDKNQWLAIEDLEEFTFDGAKIYVKLDFARKKDGVVEIYDWKTGKDDKGATVQIGAYAIYAMQKWGVPLEKIRAYLLFVASPSPKPQPQVLEEGVIREAEGLILSSIREMRRLLSDVQRNIPKAPENFAYTKNERLCNSCNFYKMCEKYLTA